jgi:hypothetical protein
VVCCFILPYTGLIIILCNCTHPRPCLRRQYAAMFRAIDTNGDAEISQIEFIKASPHSPRSAPLHTWALTWPRLPPRGCRCRLPLQALRRDRTLAAKLNLPHTIQQEDESRRLFQMRFHQIDTDDSKTITLEEWLSFYCPAPDEAPAAGQPPPPSPPQKAQQERRDTPPQNQRQEDARNMTQALQTVPKQQQRRDTTARQGALATLASPSAPRERSEPIPSPEKTSTPSKGTMPGRLDEPWQTVALGRTMTEFTGAMKRPTQTDQRVCMPWLAARIRPPVPPAPPLPLTPKPQAGRRVAAGSMSRDRPSSSQG